MVSPQTENTDGGKLLAKASLTQIELAKQIANMVREAYRRALPDSK